MAVAVVCERYRRYPNAKPPPAHPLSSLHLHHGSSIWGNSGSKILAPTSQSEKWRHPHCPSLFWQLDSNVPGQTAWHNGPSSHQRADCNITDLSESKPAFPRSIFHYAALIDFLGVPSLHVDSAISWIRDFPKFHPESSSNSASSQTALGGHRDVKCLQRGVGGWLIVANGPVGKSMAGRRVYGPLSLYEHHEREHNAKAWPSQPGSAQWCSESHDVVLAWRFCHRPLCFLAYFDDLQCRYFHWSLLDFVTVPCFARLSHCFASGIQVILYTPFLAKVFAVCPLDWHDWVPWRRDKSTAEVCARVEGPSKWQMASEYSWGAGDELFLPSDHFGWGAEVLWATILAAQWWTSSNLKIDQFCRTKFFSDGF